MTINLSQLVRFLRHRPTLRVRGWTDVILTDSDGRIKQRFVKPNAITNVGHAAANAMISGQWSGGDFSYLALGTGTIGSPTTATALAAEISTGGGARALATLSQVTTSITDDTAQLTYTWTFSASFAITEEGIFDAGSAGHMFAYQSFSAINVVTTDMVAITHSFQT